MSCSNCRQKTHNSKIKVEEGKRKAIFLNEAANCVFVTRVDGCLVKNETSADYVVSQLDVGNVIVELKGKDVDHAAEQILATAEMMNGCTKPRTPVAGLVVCAQYPRIDTKLQRLRTEFAKRFKGPIHVVTKNSEFMLGQVLSFRGPK